MKYKASLKKRGKQYFVRRKGVRGLRGSKNDPKKGRLKVSNPIPRSYLLLCKGKRKF